MSHRTVRYFRTSKLNFDKIVGVPQENKTLVTLENGKSLLNYKFYLVRIPSIQINGPLNEKDTSYKVYDLYTSITYYLFFTALLNMVWITMKSKYLFQNSYQR